MPCALTFVDFPFYGVWARGPQATVLSPSAGWGSGWGHSSPPQGMVPGEEARDAVGALQGESRSGDWEPKLVGGGVGLGGTVAEAHRGPEARTAEESAG